VLGRKLLSEVGTLVTPDTLLRWHLPESSLSRVIAVVLSDHSPSFVKVDLNKIIIFLTVCFVFVKLRESTWFYQRLTSVCRAARLRLPVTRPIRKDPVYLMFGHPLLD
jgi:hypothetical protein